MGNNSFLRTSSPTTKKTKTARQNISTSEQKKQSYGKARVQYLYTHKTTQPPPCMSQAHERQQTSINRRKTHKTPSNRSKLLQKSKHARLKTPETASTPKITSRYSLSDSKAPLQYQFLHHFLKKTLNLTKDF